MKGNKKSISVNNLADLRKTIEDSGIVLEEMTAEIQFDDKDIKGGRKIVEMKSNQLFTGQFEKTDVDNFVSIWRQYKLGNTRGLSNNLFSACKAININYHKEVCPLEVMLYTSNVISSSFVNVRLVEDVADVVYKIWRDNESYIDSIDHIIHTWGWKHVISICAVALSKIGDVEKLRWLYDNYHYDDETRFYCFYSLMESRKMEFVPEILDEIRDLDGRSDIDKRIGNKFKRDFENYFPGYYGQLNADMFSNSSPYVKSIVKKLIDDGGNSKSFLARYNNATSITERKAIIEEGFNRMFNSPDQPGLYDIVNMFKAAHSVKISERLYEKLDLDHSQGIRRSVVNATISYFNTVYHENAIKKIQKIQPDDWYYAAGRLALFHQGKITGDELMEAFLSEKRADAMKTYISGFYGMSQKGNQIQESAFRYMSKDLSRDQLSTCIANYEKLVKKYRHLYDSHVISLMAEWFGYKTVFGTCNISLADQVSCLNIIESVIDKNNYKDYANFLYYVAVEGPSFNYTVSSKAKSILDKFIDKPS